MKTNQYIQVKKGDRVDIDMLGHGTVIRADNGCERPRHSIRMDGEAKPRDLHPAHVLSILKS